MFARVAGDERVANFMFDAASWKSWDILSVWPGLAKSRCKTGMCRRFLALLGVTACGRLMKDVPRLLERVSLTCFVGVCGHIMVDDGLCVIQEMSIFI